MLAPSPYARSGPADNAAYYTMNRRRKASGKIMTSPFFKNDSVTLYNADCFSLLPSFAGKSFDYDLVWDSLKPTGFLNARRMPLRRHQLIAVFYRRPPCYNPVPVPAERPSKDNAPGRAASPNYAKGKSIPLDVWHETGYRLPSSVLRVMNAPGFRRAKNALAQFHPTQKPVELLARLVEMYTRPGETILDPFAGSCSLGVAAMLTGRKAILIERDERYCGAAAKWLSSISAPNPRLEAPRSAGNADP